MIPSMPSIVISLLLSGSMRFPPSLSSRHLLLRPPPPPPPTLDLFPLFGCHSVQRLVHLLSFILAMCPAHLHFCFSVYSMRSIILFVSLSLNTVLYLVVFNLTFSSPSLFEQFLVACQLFIKRPCLAVKSHCC